MDVVHTSGISFIQMLQKTFKGSSEFMMILSHLGDPRNAFLIYFPIAYCIHRQTGARVLWLACLAEWINAHLKWLFQGDRPYWWVKESGLYSANRSVVRQYRLTCETGPGSPSGHAMVTASVVFCMLSSILRHQKPRPLYRWCLWVLFVVFLLAVNISRVFIATHFPHQVVFGTIVGILLTVMFERVSVQQFYLAHYLTLSILIPVSCIGLYYALTALGQDPQWSIMLATKWCKKPDWIHLDTTPFNAIYRDAGSILGFGIASYIIGDTISSTGSGLSVRCMQLVLSIAVCMFGENVKPVFAEPGMYYMITYLKFCFVIVVVCFIGSIRLKKKKEEKPKQN